MADCVRVCRHVCVRHCFIVVVATHECMHLSVMHPYAGLLWGCISLLRGDISRLRLVVSFAIVGDDLMDAWRLARSPSVRRRQH